MKSPEEQVTLVGTIEELKHKGYTEEFNIKDYKVMTSSGDEVNPEDLTIEKVYRFEGNSNPDDMAVLYAIKSSSGIKGTFIDAFGLYADQDGEKIAEILGKIKIAKNH